MKLDCIGALFFVRFFSHFFPLLGAFKMGKKGNAVSPLNFVNSRKFFLVAFLAGKLIN